MRRERTKPCALERKGRDKGKNGQLGKNRHILATWAGEYETEHVWEGGITHRHTCGHVATPFTCIQITCRTKPCDYLY